jgi:hypothetical protein
MISQTFSWDCPFDRVTAFPTNIQCNLFPETTFLRLGGEFYFNFRITEKMSVKKTVLKFHHEEEEDVEGGGEVLMARALYVEGLDDDDDEADSDNRPPTDGMEYLRRVIKVSRIFPDLRDFDQCSGSGSAFNGCLDPDPEAIKELK